MSGEDVVPNKCYSCHDEAKVEQRCCADLELDEKTVWFVGCINKECERPYVLSYDKEAALTAWNKLRYDEIAEIPFKIYKKLPTPQNKSTNNIFTTPTKIGDAVTTTHADKNEDRWRVFPCDYNKGPEERKKVMLAVIADAMENLKKGTVFEIRAKIYPVEGGIKTDYGRKHESMEDMANNWAMAWYVDDIMKRKPLYQFDPDDGVDCGYYVLLARIKA